MSLTTLAKYALFGGCGLVSGFISSCVYRFILTKITKKYKDLQCTCNEEQKNHCSCFPLYIRYLRNVSSNISQHCSTETVINILNEDNGFVGVLIGLISGLCVCYFSPAKNELIFFATIVGGIVGHFTYAIGGPSEKDIIQMLQRISFYILYGCIIGFLNGFLLKCII